MYIVFNLTLVKRSVMCFIWSFLPFTSIVRHKPQNSILDTHLALMALHA